MDSNAAPSPSAPRTTEAAIGPSQAPSLTSSESSASANSEITPTIFRTSPLIRVTLLLLYVALMLPLPFLPQTAPGLMIPIPAMVVGIFAGGALLYGALSEQVIADEQGIQVNYPVWIRWLFRRGWSLAWSEMVALKPRSTGQGGIVYYFLNHTGQGFLLPMRVAGFAKLVDIVQARTGMDTSQVKPLSQPWMYLILLAFTLMLLTVDGWTVWTALHSTTA